VKTASLSSLEEYLASFTTTLRNHPLSLTSFIREALISFFFSKSLMILNPHDSDNNTVFLGSIPF
jgi:hypothetical protein